MRKFCQFLIVFVCLFNSAFAQQPTYAWSLGCGSVGTDKPQDLVIDNNGDIITTGYFSQTADFDPSSGVSNLISFGGTDIFVAKYTNNGTLLWAKNMGSTQNDESREIRIDPSGNVYITGIFYSTANFGTSTTPIILTSNGSADMFVAKIDGSGNTLWAKGFGGQMSDAANSLAVDELGNSYICGNFFGIVDFNADATQLDTLVGAGGADIFITKYNSFGNFVWAKRIGNNQTDIGVNIDYNNGFIYFTGTFGSTVDFNAGSGVNNLVINGFVTDVFISKYDTSGSYVWAKSIGSTSQDYVYGIKADASGAVYITGSFSDTLDADPSATAFNLIPTLSSTPSSTTDIYFAKYNGVGGLVWAKSIGGSRSDNPNYIDLDANGNVYLTGRFQGNNADFNPSLSDTAQLTSFSNNTDDIFIAKYTNLGEYTWAYSIGGAQNDVGQVIKIDNLGSIYFSGSVISSSVDFDFGSGTSQYSTTGGDDIFICKYNQCNINSQITQNATTLTCSQNNGATYQWVNCNGYTPVAGATSQTYNVTQSGDYAVIITLGSCVDTSNCISVNMCDFLNVTTSVNNATISANITNALYQWYDCVSNTIISGAVSQSFTPTVNGNYAVIVSQNNCVDTSTCVNINTIEVSELLNESAILIAPNPIIDLITIKCQSIAKYNLEIVDLLGKKVMNLEVIDGQKTLKNTYNISTLTNGIYLLKVTINNQIIIKKIIKN